MLRLLLLSVLFALAACKDMGGAGPVDPKKFLSSLEGPKVPTVQDTLLTSAKAADEQGDYKQAIAFYQQILHKDPKNKEVALALVDDYRRMGDYDRAIAMYDDLLKDDPQLLGAKEGKALALMAKGDFDTPATLLGEVMNVDPKRWKTLNAMGILFTTRNMQSEAQQYFNEALKYNPGSPSIKNNIGLAQALDRQFPAAIDTLQQASGLTQAGSAQRRHIDLNLALVYAAAGRVDDAKAIAETYFKGPELDNNLGLYAHLAKDDTLAKAYLNMALTESKTFYQKAWDNLETIDANSAPQPQEKKEPAPVDEEKSSDKKKKSKKK